VRAVVKVKDRGEAMNTSDTQRPERNPVRALAFAAMVAAFVMVPATFEAQLDICGCATIPNLPVFDSTTGRYPAGTVDDGSNVTVPLPPDGILRFSSFRLQNRQMHFSRNATNTPVTILVAGDATFQSTVGCCFNVHIGGASGTNGNSSTAGVGGQGGPGAFRGGDGAAQAINLAAIGGTGFGPGGGAGATASPFTHGGGGAFLSVPELIPLIGGSGGGGGSSTSASSSSCSGGGGGGGGGAILIAVNGTLTINAYQVLADGGSGNSYGNSTCSSYGGGGSGGAIRLVANRIAASGSGLFARGGGGIIVGTEGRIRLESIDTSSQTVLSTTPAAQRITGPTPLSNPVAPTVAITTVGGYPVPDVPQGRYGAIDVVLPAPGAIGVSLVTTGVPSGTTLAVTVKPRIGGGPQTQIVPLTGCDALGNCQANATFNLAAGAYAFEARATFQVQ
jgi:hypothetical protein